jgi:hypothetical protein
MTDDEIVTKAKKLLGNYERLKGLYEFMDKEYYLQKDAGGNIVGLLTQDLLLMNDREAFSIIAMSKFFKVNLVDDNTYLDKKILIGGKYDREE